MSHRRRRRTRKFESVMVSQPVAEAPPELNQGEGDRAAARHYGVHARAFVREGRVEPAAQAAAMGTDREDALDRRSGAIRHDSPISLRERARRWAHRLLMRM
jgi:hypothetical protein